MKVNEFLKHFKSGEFTFTIAKTVKDEHTPFYHNEFYQTPVRNIDEWFKWDGAKDYIVINPDSCPIDIAGNWQHWYKKGYLKCAIITTEKDLKTKYSEQQANDMIKWYDNLVKDWLNK